MDGAAVLSDDALGILAEILISAGDAPERARGRHELSEEEWELRKRLDSGSCRTSDSALWQLFQRGDAEGAEVSQRSGKPLTSRVVSSFNTGTLKLSSSPSGHSESRR